MSANTGAKVYLVGTAQYSEESCEDVRSVIQAVQPEVVVVDLCRARAILLNMDEEIAKEAWNPNLDKSMKIIKSYGVRSLLALCHIHCLGMAPGGVCITASQEAKKISGCKVVVGDRPINITLKRAISTIGFWQILKLSWNIMSTKEVVEHLKKDRKDDIISSLKVARGFLTGGLTKEDMERFKDRDLLHNVLAEIADKFPGLYSVMINERDIFLAHALQVVADAMHRSRVSRISPGKVVGVVGIGHMPGIIEKWGTVTEEQVRAVLKV